MITVEQIDRLLRNPASIHVIQDRLIATKGDSIAAESIRQGARIDLNETIRMIKDQLRDGNRLALVDIIGERLVTMIEKI